MKLSVAANYDPELAPMLAGFPVAEVYGKFPADPVGGGRPSYMGTPLTRKDLAAYVQALRDRGIPFNYLLNSSCLGNREWTRRWQRQLLQLLDSLGEMGVGRLTVATPYLLERIKQVRPEFYVKAGIFAQIDTPRRARFWQDLGADALTLESFSINRDFEALKEIRQAVRCELQLVANHPCLPNCPMQPYHQNGFAHSSNGSRHLFIDYCFLSCTLQRLEDPSMLIKAGWIRPEDTAYYEQLGYNSFKLIERGIPSSEMRKRVEAYARRKSTENLAELILPYGFRQAPKKQRFWLIRHFLRPGQISPRTLWSFRRILSEQGTLYAVAENPVRIDSSKIPADFIRGFENRLCSRLSCTECRYCEEIAATAVRIEPTFRREQLKRLQGARGKLTGGGAWGV